MFDFVFDLIFYWDYWDESYFLKLNVKKIYQNIKGLNKKYLGNGHRIIRINFKTNSIFIDKISKAYDVW